MVSAERNGAISRIAAVLCGVGGIPARLDLSCLVGQGPGDDAVNGAAAIAGQVDAIEDTSGSRAYRQHLARTLVARALRRALERAAQAGSAA